MRARNPGAPCPRLLHLIENGRSSRLRAAAAAKPDQPPARVNLTHHLHLGGKQLCPLVAVQRYAANVDRRLEVERRTVRNPFARRHGTEGPAPAGMEPGGEELAVAKIHTAAENAVADPVFPTRLTSRVGVGGLPRLSKCSSRPGADSVISLDRRSSRPGNRPSVSMLTPVVRQSHEPPAERPPAPMRYRPST